MGEMKFKIGERVRISERVLYGDLKRIVKRRGAVEAIVYSIVPCNKWPYRLRGFNHKASSIYEDALFGEDELEKLKKEKGQIELPLKWRE